MKTISIKQKINAPKPPMPKLPHFGLKGVPKLKGMIQPLRMPK